MINTASASRIAESIGVSRQFVTKHFNANFPDAKVGNKWNINHIGVMKWLESKGVDVSTGELPIADTRKSKQAKNSVSQSRDRFSDNGLQSQTVNSQRDNESVEVPDIGDHPDMSLKDIAEIFGTQANYRAWAQAYKVVQDGIEKDLKNKRIQGGLIDRSFVESHILGLIEEMNSRLLVDYPRKLVEMVYAHCESGDIKEEAEETVRDELSKPIKAAKARIIKNIKEK